jgi:pyruvate dehydrogenase E2 component (dihydrolipoamide acetyltransferase)
LNTIRRALAAQMSESARSIPQFSASCEADAGRLLASRQELQTHGMQASITVLLTQLTARALMEHPLLNARYDQDELIIYKTVNLAVAVAGEHGLTAPVIRHAEQRSLAELTAVLQELAAAARRGRLSLEQVSGATFTLSNLGMTGVSQFVPLVNPPQSAILGVGAIRPAILPTPQGGIEPAHLLTLTVSADHRVLDGAEAAAFLNTLKQSIETPVFQR